MNFAAEDSFGSFQSQKLKRKIENDSEIKENQPPAKLMKRNNQTRNQTLRDVKHCEYCKKKGEPALIFMHHTLKDMKGRTLCPALRQIECLYCGADGDDAHESVKCPRKQQIILREKMAMKRTLKTVQRRLNFIKI